MTKLTAGIKDWAIHPFLVAAYPCFYLYARHYGQVRWTELIEPLAYFWVVTAILLVLVTGLIRNARVAACVLSGGWLLFFTYGIWISGIRDIVGFERALSLMEKAVLACLGVAIAGGAIVYLRKRALRLVGLTRFLNVAMASAVLLCLAQSAWSAVHAAMVAEDPREGASEVSRGGASPDAPDIYYIILDGYGGSGYLKDAFDYDNTAFLDALRARGFYVATESHSNYSHTRLSLPSSLNMDYLEQLTPLADDKDEPAGGILARLIWENRVVSTLRGEGYEFVAFASGYTITQILSADRYLQGRRFMTEFQATIYGMTPLRSFLPRASGTRDKNRWDPVFKEFGVPFILEELGRLSRGEQPMFVFAHIISPHSPHVFDQKGVVVREPRNYRDGYCAEAAYMDATVPAVIDSILAKSPDAVIVIQGDHGPWRDYGEGKPSWDGLREDLIRDRSEILNAYRIPLSTANEKLYPTISPVNTFRVILGSYFSMNFPLLPDRSLIVERDTLPKFWVEHPRDIASP